jgi:hypothetical protein
VNSGEYRVDPVTARQGGAYLTEAARAVSEIERHYAELLRAAGESKPWGVDDLGAAFQKNYDQIVPLLLDVWPKIAHNLEQFAIGVGYAVEAAEMADEAAKKRMTL